MVKKTDTYNNSLSGRESEGCHEAYPVDSRETPTSLLGMLNILGIFIAYKASFHSWLTLSIGHSFQLELVFTQSSATNQPNLMTLGLPLEPYPQSSPPRQTHSQHLEVITDSAPFLTSPQPVHQQFLSLLASKHSPSLTASPPWLPSASPSLLLSDVQPPPLLPPSPFSKQQSEGSFICDVVVVQLLSHVQLFTHQDSCLHYLLEFAQFFRLLSL